MTTVLLVAIVVGSIAAPAVFGSDPAPLVVAVASDARPTREALTALAVEQRVEIEIIALKGADPADALRSGGVDVVVDGTTVTVHTAPSARLDSSDVYAVSLARLLDTAAHLVAAGVDEPVGLLTGGDARVVALEPADPDAATRAMVGMGASMILYVLLVSYGSWVLQGVVAERSSRVVEVLLASTRPTTLLRGKVLGIGAVALGQAALVAVLAVGTAIAVGSDLPDLTSTTVPLAFMWFVLGYSLYCCLFAAAGTLVSRSEEAASAAFPVNSLLLIGYGAAVWVSTGDGTGAAPTVVSMLPPFAPLVMPVRAALGDVPVWQFAVAVVATAGLSIAVIRFAAMIYVNRVVEFGSRPTIVSILRAARQRTPTPEARTSTSGLHREAVLTSN